MYHLCHRLRIRVRHCLCQIYIVMYMMAVHLTMGMGSEPILSIKRPVSIDTIINIDGDGDGYGYREGACKQALNDTM